MVRGKSKLKEPVTPINKLTRLSLGWNIVFMIILLIGVLLVLVPIALIVIVSFTPASSIAARGYNFIPESFTLQAYFYLFKTGSQLLTSYWVSIYTTLGGTALSLIVTTMFAYVISLRTFRFRKALTNILVFTMLFSGGLVPLYILNVNYLHINDTPWIYILSNMSVPLVNVLYTIVLRTFIRTTIPESVMESARIDGAGHFRIFIRIVLPLLKPGLATIALFNIVNRWNDFYTALLFVSKPNLMPLQTLLYQLQSKIDFLRNNSSLAGTPDGAQLLRTMPDQNLRMACTLIVILPMIAAYPYFQRYFVNGLTLGSVKE